MAFAPSKFEEYKVADRRTNRAELVDRRSDPGAASCFTEADTGHTLLWPSTGRLSQRLRVPMEPAVTAEQPTAASG
jgi:hypothetical protein